MKKTIILVLFACSIFVVSIFFANVGEEMTPRGNDCKMWLCMCCSKSQNSTFNIYDMDDGYPPTGLPIGSWTASSGPCLPTPISVISGHSYVVIETNGNCSKEDLSHHTFFTACACSVGDDRDTIRCCTESDTK
jgi:hypothetical protein